MDCNSIQSRLREFAHERDWEQFHSPKNLAMALAAESGELLEILQWLTEAQSRELHQNPKLKAKVEEEAADIAIYLLRFCDQTKVDLDVAIEAKLAANAAKYPVHLAKGTAAKYTELQ